MFSHLLWLVFGVQNSKLCEHAHVSSLQTCSRQTCIKHHATVYSIHLYTYIRNVLNSKILVIAPIFSKKIIIF